MKRIALFLTLAALVHCSSSSSSTQSECTQIIDAICQKAETCSDISSSQVSQCEQQANCSSQTGTEACSQSQVNQCLSDMQNGSCATFTAAMQDAAALPSSCNGC